WMNSQGHRENILNPNYKHFGIGRTGNYWTQLFGRLYSNDVCTLEVSTIITQYTSEASYIKPYYSMDENTQIESPNGQHRLVMQTDGNLVLYSGSTAQWALNTCGKGFGPYRMALQTDGNLVVYSGNILPLWASNTYQKQVSYLAVQNDANVVLYNRNWNAKWART
ncbi:42489_t:CDS:1, partial [Gigaspora margarita]